MKNSRSPAVVSLKARLRGSVEFEFGACSIRIVEDVGRGSFLFPTYLGRSKETLIAGYPFLDLTPKIPPCPRVAIFHKLLKSTLSTCH